MLNLISIEPSKLNLKKEINDRSLINKMRECVNEFKRDGALHSWSTFRIDGVVDATMDDENAETIISQLDGKKYFLE